MSSDNEQSNDDPRLWAYTAVDSYEPPSGPVQETVRQGVLSLWERLWDTEETDESPLTSVEKLEVMPTAVLDRIAPAPDWQEAAAALDDTLADWRNRDHPQPPVATLVLPPFCGLRSILKTWAAENEWRLIEPPTTADILNGGHGWRTIQWPADDDRPWVFADLSRICVRHARALPVMRRFLDDVYAGRLGRGVVGCTSWAWAYMQAIWPGRPLGAQTVRPFDKELLTRYLIDRANASGRLWVFRQADNGKYILPPPENVADGDVENSDFVHRLSAYSRGVLQVAWAIWRAGLRMEPDKELEEELEGEDADIHHTVWVQSWSETTLPKVPATADVGVAFVLHLLLLHDGVTLDEALMLLPLSAGQTAETIRYLRDERVIVHNEETDRWFVSAAAYPSVRQYLQSNDYLVDQF